MVYFIMTVFVLAGGFIILYFSRSLGLPAKLSEAEDLLEKGQPQKAIEILKGILEVETGHPRARYLLGKSYKQTQQYVLAVTEFKKMLTNSDYKKEFNESEIRYHLAEIYSIMKNWPKEINEYKIIQSLDPNDPIANKKMGLVYFNQADYKNSFACLRKLMELQDTDMDIIFPYSVSAFEINAYNEARIGFEKLIALDENNYSAHYYLGQVYQKEEKIPQAIEHLSLGAMDPQYKDRAYIEIGRIQLNNMQYDKAIQAFSNITFSGEREILDVYYDLAYCYEKVGNIHKAIEIWQNINSTNQNYRNVLEKIEQYHDIAKSEDISWFFSLDKDQTKKFLKEMFSKQGLFVAKEVAVNDLVYHLIAFRNRKQLDLPIVIEVHKSVKDLSEIAVHDFIKRMDQEKSSEGYLLSTRAISPRGLKLLEGRTINVITGKDFSDRINDTKKKMENPEK